MNFQNVPKKDKLVKAAFRPKQDALAFWDYDSIEMVLLAFYLATAMNDWEMANEIRGGLDPHRETAKKILGIDEPSADERDRAKRVGFSILYGGGCPTLIEQLGITFPQARGMLDAFFQARPGVARLRDAILEQVAARTTTQEPGYITTLWGRHLHPHSDHVALNCLIQGCAADLMRQGLRTAHKGLQAEGMQSHLVSTVHDEFIVDCVADELPALHRLMPQWMDWPQVSEVVPITTGMEVSFTTWAEKADYQPTSQGVPWE